MEAVFQDSVYSDWITNWILSRLELYLNFIYKFKLFVFQFFKVLLNQWIITLALQLILLIKKIKIIKIVLFLWPTNILYTKLFIHCNFFSISGKRRSVSIQYLSPNNSLSVCKISSAFIVSYFVRKFSLFKITESFISLLSFFE